MLRSIPWETSSTGKKFLGALRDLHWLMSSVLRSCAKREDDQPWSQFKVRNVEMLLNPQHRVHQD